MSAAGASRLFEQRAAFQRHGHLQDRLRTAGSAKTHSFLSPEKNDHFVPVDDLTRSVQPGRNLDLVEIDQLHRLSFRAKSAAATSPGAPRDAIA